MKIRRLILVLALVTAAWLGFFGTSCTAPVSQTKAESRSSVGSSDDKVLLEKPDSDMETHADQGELVP